jgi:hypothetical protein
MAVTRLEITRREPFAHDYERIDGIVHFAVDPSHPANATIVDLDRAARDPSGQVRFWADFCLLQPLRAERANRRLLYYVVNRGRLNLPFCRTAPQPEPTDQLDAGDGFLLRHGWTIAMCGWQWDVDRRPGLLGLEPPQALETVGGQARPIQGQVAVRFQPNEPHPDQLLSHMPLHPPPGRLSYAHKPYPAADVDDPAAVLTVRETFTGPPTVVPRARWRFARQEGGRVVADDTRVWLEGGFQPGKVYEVVYRTRICPVVGTGLLAVRDCASFLRYDPASPAAGRIDHAYGFGVSQCGRFLRQYLLDAVNLDEAGRPAYDGLLPDVAGARRGQFNHRYAQPSDPHAPGFAHLPPFLTGELIAKQRARGGLPKVIEINTSSEYWRSDCSLIHTDEAGTRDVEPPAEVRIYHFAGTRHGSGTLPMADASPTGARAANELTVVDYSPLLRAALVSLDRWVSEGVGPPPSVFPRFADGTAVPREVVLDKLAAVPGVVPLDRDALPTLRRVDLGERAADGVGRFPAELGAPFPSFVSDVDADGNEVAGIRLPDLTVPVGTHTGWVARHPSTGGEGQLLDMMGFTIPLPATPGQRQRAADPRPAIAERYRDRDDYLARVRAAADALVERRFLLAGDVDLVVALCAERYDAFAPSPALTSSPGA